MDEQIKIADWDQLLRQENSNVEWKEDCEHPNVVNKIVKTLCAFANDIKCVGGGKVICGIKEGKDDFGYPKAIPIGLDAKHLIEIKNKVNDKCHQKVEPPIWPDIYEQSAPSDPSRKILIFSIKTSNTPHRFRTKEDGAQYYVRQNDRTVPANGLIPKLMELKKNWPPFLDQTHPGSTMHSISRMVILEFLERQKLPQPIEEYFKPENKFLGNVPSLFDYLPGGTGKIVPRNFTILLFGIEPVQFFPGAYVIFTTYPGETKTEKNVITSELFGSIPKLIGDLMGKLQIHMGIDIEKSENTPFREANRLRYSERAIREAIVNAFVHRDYHSVEPIRVDVFSDRIEISNPGALPEGTNFELLKEGKVTPSWKNPSLAYFMIDFGYAQNRGQGIPTIIDDTKEISGVFPIFEVRGSFFQVTIPAFKRHRDTEVPSAIVSFEINETGKKGLILVSLGGEDIKEQVSNSLERLGLKPNETKIAVDFVSPGYVEGDTAWEELAKKLKNKIRNKIDSPEYKEFHLFYRGPVVFAPLLGALIAPVKRLFIYTYENGKYYYAFSIDKKFLKG